MSLTKVSYSMISGTPVSVLDYGAVGDGVANDAPAFNLAIARCVSTGETLYAPKPDVSYKLDTNITIDCQFQAGLYKVFGGAGNVLFSENSIGVVNPEWWYDTDLAVAINKALVAIGNTGNSGGIVDATYFKGEHSLSTTIIAQSWCTLIFNDWITLKPSTASMNMVQLRPAGNVEGGRWDVTDFTYTGAVFFLDDPIAFTKTSIRNLSMYGTFTGPGMLSTGIYFHPTTFDYNQVTVTVDTVIIDGFGVGLYLNADANQTAINANTFNNLTIKDCLNGIFMEQTGSGQVVGNFFSNITIQCVLNQIYGVYCNGAQNIFNGISLFDVQAPTIPFRFGANSLGNYVEAITSDQPISDLGTQNNFIAVADAYQLRQYRGAKNIPGAATPVFTFTNSFQAGTYTFGCYELNGATATYTNTAIVTYNGTRTDITYNFGNANMPISTSGNDIVLTPSASVFMYWTLK